MIRLVATDLDGTLLQPDGTVSPRTLEVLDAVDALGVLVVFVTGRPIRWMESLWQHVGDHGLAICSNGGVLYDVPGRAVLEARTIDPEVGLAVAERIRHAVPGSTFALEKTTGFSQEPAFPVHPDDRAGGEANAFRVQVAPLEEALDTDVVKLLALHQEHAPLDYWQRVERAADGAVTTTWSSTNALVEMSGAGVTKASTLARLCAERGLDASEVVAFGDMPNDVDMLRWAGSSYAMENGHAHTRAAAQHVAPGNDEDGVAQVLERLLLS
ncbi:HAD family hydrolase [Nocardioides sp. HDW12B]|uniref:HAD family hydrolase n=1 Tax=Nocardioides sp. HDW12B TaxID=2714939 RepID=UPI001F0EB5E6|nr:HAD family hydrolase [Nocardioides sp. HDW12B]